MEPRPPALGVKSLSHWTTGKSQRQHFGGGGTSARCFPLASRESSLECPEIFSSVQFSCSVMSNSLQPHDRSMPGLLAHHQLPEFTQTHVHCVSDAIQLSSSVGPFSSCPQSFPTSGSFPMSQLFTSGGQNIGVSASTSVLPMNIQD